MDFLFDVITTMTASKPQLKSYLDIHHYLADLYKYRKATETDFSYESWAQELGIEHRSYLRQIVIGRRSVSTDIADLICQRLHLQGPDKEYFEVLVLYSSARTSTQRNIYGKRLARLMKSEFAQVEIKNTDEFVLDPLLPRLHTLLSFPDAPQSEAQIGQMLNKSPDKIKEALASLVAMKLVSTNEAGQTVSVNEHFTVPTNLGNPSLIKYHQTCLQEAIEASQLEAHRRRYESVIVAMNKEEYGEFLGDLKEFIDQTLARFNSAKLESREIFQLNFNAHPVSSLRGAAEESKEA